MLDRVQHDGAVPSSRRRPGPRRDPHFRHPELVSGSRPPPAGRFVAGC